jgi:hypothetical protein
MRLSLYAHNVSWKSVNWFKSYWANRYRTRWSHKPVTSLWNKKRGLEKQPRLVKQTVLSPASVPVNRWTKQKQTVPCHFVLHQWDSELHVLRAVWEAGGGRRNVACIPPRRQLLTAYKSVSLYRVSNQGVTVGHNIRTHDEGVHTGNHRDAFALSSLPSLLLPIFHSPIDSIFFSLPHSTIPHFIPPFLQFFTASFLFYFPYLYLTQHPKVHFHVHTSPPLVPILKQ